MEAERQSLSARNAAEPRVRRNAIEQIAGMTRHRLFRIIVQICRFALVALFLFTAGAKLAIVKAFAGSVFELLAASGFDPVRWMWPATIGVIAIEIITAALLLIPKTVRLGALFAAALLIGFAAYALYYVYVLHGEPLECGCFGGIIASQLGVKTTLRNLVLLIPAFIVLFGYRRKSQKVAAFDPHLTPSPESEN